MPCICLRSTSSADCTLTLTTTKAGWSATKYQTYAVHFNKDKECGPQMKDEENGWFFKSLQSPGALAFQRPGVAFMLHQPYQKYFYRLHRGDNVYWHDVAQEEYDYPLYEKQVWKTSEHGVSVLSHMLKEGTD